jgi:hypothetical protein
MPFQPPPSDPENAPADPALTPGLDHREPLA